LPWHFICQGCHPMLAGPCKVCFSLRITRDLCWTRIGIFVEQTTVSSGWQKIQVQSMQLQCSCNCLDAPYAKSICDALRSSPANHLAHSDGHGIRRNQNQNFKQNMFTCWVRLVHLVLGSLGSVTKLQCSKAGAIFDLAACNPETIIFSKMLYDNDDNSYKSYHHKRKPI
jgi:hypothetical protein